MRIIIPCLIELGFLHGEDSMIRQVGQRKGEIFGETHRHTVMWISESWRFKPDHLSRGAELGHGVTLQKEQWRNDGKGEELTGLESRVVVHVKKAS